MHLLAKANSLSLQTFMAIKTHSDSDSLLISNKDCTPDCARNDCLPTEEVLKQSMPRLSRGSPYLKTQTGMKSTDMALHLP